MLSKIPWGEEIDMSTTTDTTTRPSEEEPVDPAPVPLPVPEFDETEKDDSGHEPGSTECGIGCVHNTP